MKRQKNNNYLGTIVNTSKASYQLIQTMMSLIMDNHVIVPSHGRHTVLTGAVVSPWSRLQSKVPRDLRSVTGSTFRTKI